jgi:hypothetical protein
MRKFENKNEKGYQMGRPILENNRVNEAPRYELVGKMITKHTAVHVVSIIMNRPK